MLIWAIPFFLDTRVSAEQLCDKIAVLKNYFHGTIQELKANNQIARLKKSTITSR